ncbi:MAG: GTP-binding protein, partial [Bacteroidia bacterium]
GTVIAVVTQGVVFDVTGGLLATLGFLVAGVSAAIKRRKIMKQAKQAVKENRLQLEEKVNGWLSEYIADLIAHIDSHMTDFDSFLKQEGETLAKYDERSALLNDKIKGLESKLD